MIPSLADSNPIGVNQVLSPHMGVFFIAFAVTFATTPLMRLLAVRNGIVDWPDLRRKTHIEPVAYLGGVAIFLGWTAGVVLCFLKSPDQLSSTAVWMSYVRFPISVVLGAIAIVITGIVDDVYGVSPRIKIGGQLLAAGFLAHETVGGQLLGARLVSDSFEVIGIGISDWPAYILGTIIIAAFVLGSCNSVNLLDGLDGLAAGVSAIAVAGFLFLSVYAAMHLSGAVPGLQGSDPLAAPVRVVMCLAILGALLGFLPYNFNPANIFMGDAGSLLVGYLCATTILMFANIADRGPLFVLSALIIFAVPITDTMLAILRRKLRGHAISRPDDNHLHHQIFNAFKNLKLGPGMSVKLAVFTIYVIAATFAALGCSMVFVRGTRYVLAVFVVIFSFVAVVAYKVGHRAALLDKLQAAEHVAGAAPGVPGQEQEVVSTTEQSDTTPI